MNRELKQATTFLPQASVLFFAAGGPRPSYSRDDVFIARAREILCRGDCKVLPIGPPLITIYID